MEIVIDGDCGISIMVEVRGGGSQKRNVEQHVDDQ